MKNLLTLEKSMRADKKDAYKSGCNGLKSGWACLKATGKRVHALEVRKNDGPFICRECLSDAIHHYCTEKVHHFAHHARVLPTIGPKESALHKACKETFYNTLSKKFHMHKWVCDDVRIPEKKDEKLPALQPDIGGRINGKRVAIEIQNSSLTIPKIIKRSIGYSKRDISILWIVPLRGPIGDEIFQPRLFERYLHSIYYGRVYYWLPEYDSKVLPVHFSIAYREIPYSEWYEDGEFREGGGYQKPYKRIRKPNPAKLISIEEYFYHHRRGEHRPWNELKTVPEMNILMDSLSFWWDKNEQNILDHFYPENSEAEG